jgi:hypothetical protein
VTKKIQERSGGSKQVKVNGDEEEFPNMDTVAKLNSMASKRLSELVNKATPAERLAIASL